MGKYVLLTGIHEQGGKRYKPGDTVESDIRLDKMYANKFERAGYSKRKVTGDTDDEDDEVEDARVEKVASKSRRKAVKKMMTSEDEAARKARRNKKKRRRNDDE